MEPSFLLEGVAHPDRFLPPKHEYHCTQMAMRQLERLNGGYRPVYAQKDPILPQTGKLTSVHQALYNIDNTDIYTVEEAEPRTDKNLNCGVSWNNDSNSNCTDFSDGFLNTGNISILASSLDGEDIWGSGANDSIDVLSVTGSIIQYDPNSSADKNFSDDSIPSPFLQMSCIQLKDLDTVPSSVYSPFQGPSISSNDISLPGISIHSHPSASYNTPRIIPTSVGLTGAETGSLHISELEHTIQHAPDFSLSYNNLLAQSEGPTPAQAYCIPVISKALRKKLAPGLAHNHATSNLVSPRCAHPKVKEPDVFKLPPVLKILQQKVRYCGHVKAIPAAQVPGNHIDCLPQLQRKDKQQSMIHLPYLVGHIKHYDRVESLLSEQVITNDLVVLPRLKR